MQLNKIANFEIHVRFFKKISNLVAENIIFFPKKYYSQVTIKKYNIRDASDRIISKQYSKNNAIQKGKFDKILLECQKLRIRLECKGNIKLQITAT